MCNAFPLIIVKKILRYRQILVMDTSRTQAAHITNDLLYVITLVADFACTHTHNSVVITTVDVVL